MTTETTTAKFEEGRTYYGRSIGDHNCIIRVSVARRTAKTIVTAEGKRLRIKKNWRGVESVEPWGQFSMSPSVAADQTAELRPDWEN